MKSFYIILLVTFFLNPVCAQQIEKLKLPIRVFYSGTGVVTILHVLKNVDYFLQKIYNIYNIENWVSYQKPTLKMLVIAYYIATAYALYSVTETIGVFATAGNVASEEYLCTLKIWAARKATAILSIISQGGVGLAESINRDYNYFSDTVLTVRNDYKRSSVKDKKYLIETLILNAYKFNKSGNNLLCEYDNAGRCFDIQLNASTNYVRYHLVSLLE
jgi:hypothetical protein